MSENNEKPLTPGPELGQDVAGDGEEEGYDEYPPPSPLEEAAAHLLVTPEIKAGIAQLLSAGARVLERQGQTDPNEAQIKAAIAEAERRHHEKLNLHNSVFCLFVLGAICILIWNDKIAKDLSGTLLASLIAYWFGSHRKSE